MTKNTTTICALLPERTQTRADRIQSAHSRHSINNSGTWTAGAHYNIDNPAHPLEGINPPIHRQTAEQLYRTADTAVYIALRARHEKSGIKMFSDLMNSTRADRAHRNINQTAADILTAERERDKLRELCEMYQAISRAKTTDPATAQAAARTAAKLHRAAEQQENTRKDLERKMDSTSTDREQLVHDAIIAALDPQNSTEPDRAMRRTINAAGRAISELAAPDALRSTSTKWTPINATEAAAEISAHPNITVYNPESGEEEEQPARIPFRVREGSRAGYYEIRWTAGSKPRKDGTQSRPAGWYKVSHYHRPAPYVSYDVWMDGAQDIATNGGINAITSQSAAEEIRDLLNRANLTDREQLVVLKLIGNTARAHAERAHQEAHAAGLERIAAADRNHKSQERERAAKATDRAYFDTLWASAFQLAEVYAASTRSTMRTRIQARLTAARSAAEEPTQAEQDEKSRRQLAKMQSGRPYAGHSKQPHRVDMCGIWCRLGEAVPAQKPVIRWTHTAEPQSISAEEAARIERDRIKAERDHIQKHRREAARIEHRRQYITRAHSTRTAWAYLDAQESARVFWDALTPRQQDNTIRAVRQMQERRAAYHATMNAHGVLSLNSTIDQWRAWTAAERRRHMDYLNADPITRAKMERGEA